MTHKLFHDDPYMKEFDAQVLSCAPQSEPAKGYRVYLDRTAFYAEAGGQPCDLGKLGGANVLDVQEDETGDIYHVTDQPLSGAVHGAIEWERRFDHMQQHSGQHLLSNRIAALLGGYTFGLHIGADEVTIDTDLKAAPDRAVLDKLESEVNALIWADYATRQWFPDEAELRELPLRKPPTVAENIRIVMTGDFECVACCGTHTSSTGQIGLMTILGAHPARGKVRFSFLCGGRAFRRLRAEGDQCRGAALALSTTYENLTQEVERLSERLKDAQRALRDYQTREMLSESPALVADAQVLPSGGKAVVRRFAEGERDSLIRAASDLLEGGAEVALLSAGAPSGDIAVFASAETSRYDVATLLRETLKPLGGRGGGKPHFAQGGAPVQLAEDALRAALARLQ